MTHGFVVKIDKQIVDFSQPINLNELQEYEITIDPQEKIKARLFLGDQELFLKQLYKPEKPNYKFKATYKFENIGVQTILLEVNGETFKQKLRIKPTKISQTEYEMILNQIRDIVYNIIFETFGKAEEEIRIMRLERPKSPLEFFYFFEKNFAIFKTIFQRLEKAPNVTVKERLRQVRFFETEHFQEVIEYEKPTKRIAALQDRLKGLLPRLVVTSENFLSYDVYENRLLKHYLGLVANKLNFLEKVALNEKRRESKNQEVFGGDPGTDANFRKRIDKWQNIIDKCQRYRQDTNRMRNSLFLQDVTKIGLVKTSMVLQKEPRYKAFYKLYRDFRKNSVIEVSSKYFHLPVTEAWRIYEIWVLLKLYETLIKTGFKLGKQRLLNVDTRYIYDAKKVTFNFDLTKNRPLLQLRKEGKIAKLYYQRKYPVNFHTYGSVDEHSQIPDIAIEIFEEGERIPKIVIVDPKYRVRGDKPPESAKKELSHYVNMIRDKPGKRLVKCAYIVYPGKITRSTKKGDYGYIGLTPGSDAEPFEEKIHQMIGS